MRKKGGKRPLVICDCGNYTTNQSGVCDICLLMEKQKAEDLD